MNLERPAGWLYNVAATGSGSPLSLADDFTELWASVRQGEPDAPHWIMSSRAALYLSMLKDGSAPLFPGLNPTTGGQLFGAPVVLTRAAGANVVLVDASQIGVYDGGYEVVPSTQAAVSMSDAPSSPTTLVSAFQSDSVFLRFTKPLSWGKATDDAIGFVTLAALGGSPS